MTSWRLGSKKSRRLNRLFRFALILTGFLALIGCEASDPHQPTLAALLSFPTQSPQTSIREAMQPATAVPTPVPAPTTRLAVVPVPTRASLAREQSRRDVPVPADDYPTPTILPGASEERAEGSTTSSVPWLLAYDSDVEGNDEIYLLSAANGLVENVTHHPAEDRYPAWSPDGKRITFQSNRDGNWEIYTLDLQEKKLTRLTYHPAYDGVPSWSPDGNWVVFESYREVFPCQTGTPTPDPPACPDLEIFRIPAQGGSPNRLTYSSGGDHQPVWSPNGDWIAFTSWRDGDKEIYVKPAGGGTARNVSSSAGDDWSPAWSPDGTTLIYLSERAGVAELYHQALEGGPSTRLTTINLPQERPTWWQDGSILFSRYDPGSRFEAHNPYRPGEYHLYRLPPGVASPQALLLRSRARHPAAAPLTNPSAAATTGSASKAHTRVYDPADPAHLALNPLPEIKAPDTRLVAGVDEAFRAWRDAVQTRSGYDYLGQVSDMFRPAAYFSHRLGYLSWHKAGRAVDLLFDWRDADGNNALYVVREELAGEVFWRLFLKCAVQDGSLGEPLTQAPWYFWWHAVPSGNADVFANGGRRLPIPAGYFVDVTALAERYSWSRIASYRLDDFHWQRDSTATEYWHYQHLDGLTWYQAMSQIYKPEMLEALFSRPVAATRGQSTEVMDGKGLPSVETP